MQHTPVLELDLPTLNTCPLFQDEKIRLTRPNEFVRRVESMASEVFEPPVIRGSATDFGYNLDIGARGFANRYLIEPSQPAVRHAR